MGFELVVLKTTFSFSKINVQNKKDEEEDVACSLYTYNVVQKGISYTSYKSCSCRYVYCTFINLLYLFVAMYKCVNSFLFFLGVVVRNCLNCTTVIFTTMIVRRNHFFG